MGTGRPTSEEYGLAAAKAFEAFDAADGGGLRSHWHADASYHVPGSNPLSGDHRGIREILALAERCRRQVSGRTYRVEVTEVAAGGGYVAVTGQVSASAQGRPYEWRASWFYFFRDGLVNQCWLRVDNVKAFDEFWAGRHADSTPRRYHERKERKGVGLHTHSAGHAVSAAARYRKAKRAR